MDKYEIIELWSTQNLNNSELLSNKQSFSNLYNNKAIFLYKYYIIDEIIKKSKEYFDGNNIKLIKLDKLDNNNDFYYWYICNNSGIIYNIKLIFTSYNKPIKKINVNINNLLYKINRYKYTEILIMINNVSLVNNYSFEIFNSLFIIDFININIKVINGKLINSIIYKPNSELNNFNKRSFQEMQNSSSIHISNRLNKKIKINHISESSEINWNNMVTASSIRNYMLGDPLIDYLKEYNITSLNQKIITMRDTQFLNKNNKFNNNQDIPKLKSFDIFTKYILDAGIVFENELIKNLNQNHNIIKVAEYIHSKKKEKLEETIDLMKKGTPIIYQGVLHNFENNTYGLPDLLVRSDYLNTLLGYDVITKEEENIPSPNLNINFHYKVIDIKHSTIYLRSDNTHVLNSDSIPAYKGQIYIYVLALNNILGIHINKGFIWGKKYNYEFKGKKYEINNFLNKLGIIDYDSVDSDYIKLTNKAIKWIRTVRNESHNWSLLPIPSRQELFPNMKNEKDAPYRSIKLELSEQINEITNIWNCGIKKRQIAHQNHIYRWTDINCTAENMGFTKNKINNTINSILDINRQNNDIIRPKKIIYDRKNWIKATPNTLEFYLDFETLNSNFGSIIKDNIISYHNNQFIFMIGVGYSKNKKWIFKTFVMNTKSNDNEKKIFNQFFSYINKIIKENNKKKAKFYHWSCAEPSMYNTFKQKNINTKFKDNNYSFYDLNKIFISEPVVIKGALNFSLKTIAKAFYKYKFINSNWDLTSPCSNGLTAMILANNLYENIDPKDNIINQPIMKDIIYYNEIDCRILWEIHNYIKKNL